jgi:ankyrin repeat protein
MIKVIRQIIFCITSIFLLSSTDIFSGDLVDCSVVIPKDVLEAFILPDLSLTGQTAFALTDKKNKEFVEQNYYLCTKQQYFQILRELFLEGATKIENAPKKYARDLLDFIRCEGNPKEKAKIVKYNSRKFVTEVLKSSPDHDIILQISEYDGGELLMIGDHNIWNKIFDSTTTAEIIVRSMSKKINPYFIDRNVSEQKGRDLKISESQLKPFLLYVIQNFKYGVFDDSSGGSFLFRDADFFFRGKIEDNALELMKKILALDKIDFVVNIPNKSGYTPLAHYLFGCNNYYPENSAKVIQLLLERGAIADLSDPKRTIFHYMCAQLNCAKIEYIVHAYYCITHLPNELIADLINKTDSQGNTALHIICAQETTGEKILQSQEFTIKFFLDHGADLTIKNNQEKTALSLRHAKTVYKMRMTKRIEQRLFINFDNLRNENFFPSFSFLLNLNFYRKIFEFLKDMRRQF